MSKLPIERSVLKFNGELEIDTDLSYGEEIVVVVKARIGAPAFTELKNGLKQIHKAEIASLHLASDDERADLELYLDGGTQLPLPFNAEPEGEPVYELSQEEPVAYVATGETPVPTYVEYDQEPVLLGSNPKPRREGSRDPILAAFLEGGR
jgi:hypothetical protein